MGCKNYAVSASSRGAHRRSDTGKNLRCVCARCDAYEINGRRQTTVKT